MKIQLKIFSLMISLLILGCSRDQQASFNQSAEKSVATPAGKALKGKTDDNVHVNVERKLIKEGTLEFESNDIESTRNSIFQSIKKYNGYASSDKENKTPGRISNTIIIRVPAKNFDLLVNEATKGVTSFDRKNINVKDVTEEFLDIQARLKTQRELEGRYLELLEKAIKVTEILEIQKQAGQLRSEIESTEGRLKYLENNVSFSTLTLSFYQPLSNEIQFANKFKQATKIGWENLIWTFVFLTHIWPFILIFLGMVFGFRMWRKKDKFRKTDPQVKQNSKLVN